MYTGKTYNTCVCVRCRLRMCQYLTKLVYIWKRYSEHIDSQHSVFLFGEKDNAVSLSK